MRRKLLICISVLCVIFSVGCQKNNISEIITPIEDEMLEERIRNNSANSCHAVYFNGKYFVSLTDEINDGGLYCFDENFENITKIFDGFATELNVTENEIYFSSEDGVYRLEPISLTVEKLFDLEDIKIQYFYDGNFYGVRCYDSPLKDYIVRIDAYTGEVENLVKKDNYYNFTIYNNALIYLANNNKTIMQYDLDSGKTTQIAKSGKKSGFGDMLIFYNGDLFCIEDESGWDYGEGKLCRISGNGKKTVIVDDLTVVSFTLYKDKCYFSGYKDGDRGTYVADLDGSNRIKISDDSGYDIDVAGNRLFFRITRHGIIIDSIALDGSDVRCLNESIEGWPLSRQNNQ